MATAVKPGRSLNFLKYKNRETQYRSVDERVHDVREVEVHADIEECKLQASRCMDCGIPFCHSYGCPLANVIPEMNAAVAEDDYRTAWRILRSTSSFPEFTSRVCPALCEAACTAGVHHGCVSVRQIEYMTIEEAFRLGWEKARPVPVRIGRKAAVIGAGPSGLAAADTLNQAGFEVTVFEKNQKPGGLLRYGIPDFKLEKRFVERRIAILEQEGIHFECGVDAGTDIGAAFLKRRFDVLVLCIGTPLPRDLAVPGRELKGTYFAVDYLSSQNRAVSGEAALSIDARGRHVVVIGGGDTGSDCIGTARRQGALDIVQLELMPEAPAGRHSSTPWPMYPYMKKHSASLEEGVRSLFEVGVTALEGENGVLRSLKAQKLLWQKDALGRPSKFVPAENSAFELPADLIFLAMGFRGVPSEYPLVKELALAVDARGKIVSSDGATSDPQVFAAGDCATGQSLVVRSIASGRACAEAVIRTFGKEGR